MQLEEVAVAECLDRPKAAGRLDSAEQAMLEPEAVEEPVKHLAGHQKLKSGEPLALFPTSIVQTQPLPHPCSLGS